MSNAVKITKRESFATLRECVLEHYDWFESTEEVDALVEFIDHEVELLDKRAESAKKYAKKTEKANDELSKAIADVLASSDSAMTIPEIVDALDEALAATPQKLTYRLNKMVAAESVERTTVSIKEEGKTARKINAYKWIASTDSDSDSEVEE